MLRKLCPKLLVLIPVFLISGCLEHLQVERNFSIQAELKNIDGEVFSQRVFLRENEVRGYKDDHWLKNYKNIGPTSIGFRMSSSPSKFTQFRILHAKITGNQDKKAQIIISEPSAWQRSVEKKQYIFNHADEDRARPNFPNVSFVDNQSLVYYNVDWIGFAVELENITPQDYNFVTKLEYCKDTVCSKHEIKGIMYHTHGNSFLSRLFDMLMSA